MKQYDLIVAGAGLGGLSFLWHLMECGLGERRVLVIDRGFAPSADRTWCFWGDEDAHFAEIAETSWGRAEVCFDAFKVVEELEEYRYYCVKSEAFRTLVFDRLQEAAGITLVRGNISEIGEDSDGPYVVTDQGRYDAKWVLQSVRFGDKDAEKSVRYPVRQHFGGLEIRTHEPVFRPDRFTMMDFRVPQQGGVSFVYILPFAPDRALVEHTVFSSTPMTADAHYRLTDRYIRARLNVDYAVERREFGDLPMDDRMPSQQSSDHVFNVGIVGGHIKPSTGYTFARVQRHTHTLASAFSRTGRLTPIAESSPRFRLYDQLLLRALQAAPAVGIQIFRALFTNNPLDRVLRFLDERTGVREELTLFRTLPFMPFIAGLPEVLGRTLLRFFTRLPMKGLGIALSIFALWIVGMGMGLSASYPGAGQLPFDALWVLGMTFLSPGMFITGHECMHQLVVPGYPRINAGIGWLVTWSYAGLNYGALNRAHHRHHAAPATVEDPDFHRGNSSVAHWYFDFMRQYMTWQQWTWLSCLITFFLVGLSLPVERIAFFWALPLILSTMQLFLVGTWLPHRPGDYQGDGPLRARSVNLPPILSFFACFHFGYHFEHHARPDLPWWRLWRVRGVATSDKGAADSRDFASLVSAGTLSK